MRKPSEEPPKKQLLKNKQCKKVVFPLDSNLQSLDYRSTAPPPELEKTSPRMLNFGYLNPATCLFYDVNNNALLLLTSFTGSIIINISYAVLPPLCSDENVVVPVAYTIGANSVSKHIPPQLRDQVTTGFMQFRAKRASGEYFAFCPAVR